MRETESLNCKEHHVMQQYTPSPERLAGFEAEKHLDLVYQSAFRI